MPCSTSNLSFQMVDAGGEGSGDGGDGGGGTEEGETYRIGVEARF